MTVDPGATVCDIARAHGFHELGRFAASYRRSFGELEATIIGGREGDMLRVGRLPYASREMRASGVGYALSGQ